MTAREHWTDVSLTCPCCGVSRRISARKAKALRRLPSPAHEIAVHQLVAA